MYVFICENPNRIQHFFFFLPMQFVEHILVLKTMLCSRLNTRVPRRITHESAKWFYPLSVIELNDFLDSNSIKIRAWNQCYISCFYCNLNQGVQQKKLHSLWNRKFSSLSKAAATAPEDYPTAMRWTAFPPANLVHLSIGAIYVYSMWTPSLSTCLGVVGSAANDWTQSDLIPVFSVAALTLGVTTNLLGKWVEDVGPRKSGVIGSLFWGSSLCLTGIGVQLHCLPVIYAGYGILGGIG